MPTFEDLLKPAVKCKTCSFIAGLEPGLRAEVEAAVSKPIYSDQVLANGMRKIETEFNDAPGEKSVGLHRLRGHAS